MTTKTDVAIVGAGAAGLAAARELRALGVDHVVLEAKPVVGGRTISDEATFGFPYDLGGFWISNDGDNFLVDAAERLGFDTSDQSFPGLEIPMLMDDRWETQAENSARLAFNDEAMATIGAFNPADPDRSIAEVAGTTSPWYPLLASWVGMLNGLPMERTSAVDQANLLHGETVHQVPEGMGRLVQAWAGVPDVMVNTPVRAIDWNDAGVELDVGDDVVTARALILTASVGVLASDTISFARTMPDRVREALGYLPMGTVNRIAVQFDGDVFGETCPPSFGRFVSADDHIYIMTRLVGENVALGYVGNELTLSLEQQPDDVAVDLLCDALALGIGTDVRDRITATLCTRWGSDPWSLGSYAAAEPGSAWARAALQEPWDDRVFLAGEATSLTQFSLVHGAANEGIRAARAASAVL
ncbi:MAG: NAD(P)-binding protein [Rhodospirillaceae bacterium]|jgi:monoamine oxidase|nr:NAD(P)-binding protein [Rhodospirillaceae bacterium]MBT6511093.1 NAD(P)-binding protein [Rhodospirillaceae bacterium]